MKKSVFFKAISDPTRRQILDHLAKKNLSAGEIADSFHLTKATISHHLAVLKEAGLILDERKGQFIIYSLNTTVFQEVISWLYDLMQTWGKKDSPKGS